MNSTIFPVFLFFTFVSFSLFLFFFQAKMYVQVGIKTRVEHFTNGILGPSVNGQMPGLAIGHRWSLIQILMAKGFNWPLAIELVQSQLPKMANAQWSMANGHIYLKPRIRSLSIIVTSIVPILFLCGHTYNKTLLIFKEVEVSKVWQTAISTGAHIASIVSLCDVCVELLGAL